MTSDQKNAALAAAALLEARQEAIDCVIAALAEGMATEDRKSSAICVLEMLAREAAGRGFDAGVKWVGDFTKNPD